MSMGRSPQRRRETSHALPFQRRPGTGTTTPDRSPGYTPSRSWHRKGSSPPQGTPGSTMGEILSDTVKEMQTQIATLARRVECLEEALHERLASHATPALVTQNATKDAAEPVNVSSVSEMSIAIPTVAKLSLLSPERSPRASSQFATSSLETALSAPTAPPMSPRSKPAAAGPEVVHLSSGSSTPRQRNTSHVADMSSELGGIPMRELQDITLNSSAMMRVPPGTQYGYPPADKGPPAARAFLDASLATRAFRQLEPPSRDAPNLQPVASQELMSSVEEWVKGSTSQESSASLTIADARQGSEDTPHLKLSLVSDSASSFWRTGEDVLVRTGAHTQDFKPSPVVR